MYLLCVEMLNFSLLAHSRQASGRRRNTQSQIQIAFFKSYGKFICNGRILPSGGEYIAR